ncbi:MULTISPECIES: bifunctional demethylmenaquinone methyltransferase/2-methoxy-6-polyprenyl-1,4-benzoquinol methylase UbiE [Spirulina sp. CCY15215]|uniref:bifunctional demethylmenaquinone methyltransferase/2-methoxy-6-polyprenyl-1,4-benzoquinol methylase UbiE n=1 Tax=Spirulina sp. CCY15215 TaxID=2767591 RepID=UPI00194FE918|nr:bifunctional demethylmenaquinone methyltransferase/2-methoxy-6-polyprenyl-1,4-benzoquinol methylase UbiE [Spirulina major]
MTDSDIQALFDRIAPVYDRLNQNLSWGLHRVWKQMTVKWANPQPGDRALDVCCGSGDLAFLLAKQVGKEGQVVGLDFSSQQLAIAWQKASQMIPSPPINWVEGNAIDLPFPENHFDCGTMGYGLRNVPDIPRSLAELHRVLKPRAKVAILDFHRPALPLMQDFQQWYLDNIVVPTAEKFALKADYEYIFPSLERFPLGTEQVKLGKAAGFKTAIHYPIMGGMMGVLVLEK